MPISGVRTSGNTIAMIGGGDAFGLAWLQDWAGVLFEPASDNGGMGDRFWFVGEEGGSTRFAWDGSFRSIAEFGATPGGRDAAYLGDADLTALLEEVGIPTGPAPDHPQPLPSPRELFPVLLLALAAAVAGGLVILVLLRRRRRRATTDRPPEP
jgi:hypothetical protein